jgi:hypothetical protein
VENLIPKSYISYNNVANTCKTYLPQRATGFETAYEYIVNNTRNSSLAVRIASYRNYTDALKVYNYLYGLKSKQAAIQQVLYSELNQEFSFSNIESLENYSDFYDFNLTTRLNYSTLYMLVSNSVAEFYSLGLKITLSSPSMSMQSIVTATPAVQIGTNFNAVYILIMLAIAALVIIAVYLSNRRHSRNS